MEKSSLDSNVFPTGSLLDLETSLLPALLFSFEVANTTSHLAVQNIPSIPSAFTVTSALILTFVSIAILHYYLLTRWSRTARFLRQLNGGTVLPFIGNAYEFIGPSWKTQESFTNYGKKYGKIAPFWLGYYPLILTTCPKLVEKILSSTTEHLERAGPYQQFHDLVTDGLVLSGGEMWKRDRTALNHAFTKPMLDNFMKTFNKEGRILVEKLAEKMQLSKTGSDERKKPVNLFPTILTAGMEMILVATLGLECNLQEQGENCRLIRALKTLVQGTHDRIFKPYLFSIPLVYRLMGKLRAEHEALAVLNEPCLTARKRKELEMNNQTKTDGIQINNDISNRKKKAKPVLDILMEQTPPPTEITYRDHLTSFLGAGAETTASSVYQTLFLLALNPEHQKRCQEEIDFIFGDKTGQPFEVTQYQISEAKYVERCWKETLRLTSPIPVIGRTLTKDLVLDDGLILPKDATVLLSIWDMHRDPDVYESPLEFNPDRFLPHNVAERSTYSYLPFAHGVRNCIGLKYSYLEAMILLIQILARFDVYTDQKLEDIKTIFGVPGIPTPDIEVALVERKRNV